MTEGVREGVIVGVRVGGRADEVGGTVDDVTTGLVLVMVAGVEPVGNKVEVSLIEGVFVRVGRSVEVATQTVVLVKVGYTG